MLLSNTNSPLKGKDGPESSMTLTLRRQLQEDTWCNFCVAEFRKIRFPASLSQVWSRRLLYFLWSDSILDLT